MTELTVQLDWKPNAQFAGLLLALTDRWFAEAGLDVRILPWRPGTDPLAEVSSRIGLIAVSEDNLAIRAAASGQHLKILGAMLQRSPLAWMVLADSPIETFADFGGTTIGVHIDGVTGLQFAMRTAGLDLDAANVVDVPYDKTQRLRDGSIDVCQCNGLVEPIEMAHRGVPVRVLWACDVGYSVYSQVLTASADTFAVHRSEVEEFTRILWRGWRAVYDAVDSTSEMIVDDFLHETSPAVQHEILEAMKPFVFGHGRSELDASDVEIGHIDPARLQDSIDLLRDSGVISRRLDATALLPRTTTAT